MKKIYFIFLCLFTVLVSGCSVNSDHEEQNPDFEFDAITQEYPVILKPSPDNIEFVMRSGGMLCIFTGEKYGFMSEQGVEVTPYIYDYADPFSEGLACVYYEGKYGYIDENGDIALPFIYDGASSFVEGLAYFETGDQYGFMDKQGDAAFLLDCDSVSSFRDGLAYFSIDGKYGYIDKSGNIVIPPIYDDADYFQDGAAKVRINTKTGVINKAGVEIVPISYEQIEEADGFFIVTLNGKYGCFQRDGKAVLPVTFEELLITDDRIIFRLNGKYGLADAYGQIRIEPAYDWLTVISKMDSKKDMVIFDSNGTRGIIDYENNIKMSLPYDHISYKNDSNGLLQVYSDGKYGFLNLADFSEKIPLIFENTSYFTKDKAAVRLDGKYGVIDKEGEIIVPFEYDYIRQIENYYIIQLNNKYGILNEHGEMIIPATYGYFYDNVYNDTSSRVSINYRSDDRDHIVVIGENQSIDISKVVSRHEITPRIKPYNDFIKSDLMGTDSAASIWDISESQLKGFRRTYKLYGTDGFGTSVLYFYSEPVIHFGHPWSYSGLYSLEDGEVKRLLYGEESGGSIGGDYVCFWDDKEHDRIAVGLLNYAGGFGGSAYGGEIYDFKDGSVEKVLSHLCISQTTANYEEVRLIENANLFYGYDHLPHTKETILEAEFVTAYLVDGIQTTKEFYENEADRFRVLIWEP